MTRKHYIALADSLGLELRHTDAERVKDGIWRAIHAICGPLKQENSRFDKETFLDHITAVSNGTKEITT